MPAPQLLNTTPIPIDNAIDQSSSHAVSNAAVAAALAGKSDESTVETISTASISLTLAQNTIYQCTNAAITDLTFLGVANDFIYATLMFVSPSTATTFAMPNSGWYCVGDDTSNGAFTPVSDMRYNLAIEQEYGRIAVYCMRAL